MSKTGDYTVTVGKIPTRMVVTTPPPATAYVNEVFDFGGYLEETPTGKRIGGVRVTLYINDNTGPYATTDSNGGWNIRNGFLNAGTAKLYVEYAGDETRAGC